jgi:hypothetical protein
MIAAIAALPSKHHGGAAENERILTAYPVQLRRDQSPDHERQRHANRQSNERLPDRPASDSGHDARTIGASAIRTPIAILNGQSRPPGAQLILIPHVRRCSAFSRLLTRVPETLRTRSRPKSKPWRRRNFHRGIARMANADLSSTSVLLARASRSDDALCSENRGEMEGLD